MQGPLYLQRNLELAFMEKIFACIKAAFALFLRKKLMIMRAKIYKRLKVLMVTKKLSHTESIRLGWMLMGVKVLQGSHTQSVAVCGMLFICFLLQKPLPLKFLPEKLMCYCEYSSRPLFSIETFVL